MWISVKHWKRGWKRAHRCAREIRMIAKGVLSRDHPILVHVIPMRRCNLACAYCNEYDGHSKPVPLETMNRRLDRLAALGTTVITLSGGEPLLHPDLDPMVARIRRRGIMAGLITNGYLLTAERIQRLNRAGLEHLQISIDNVLPDEVSKKSLKVLDKKLRMLAEHAEFHVNINSVVGGGIAPSARRPDDRPAGHRAGFHVHGGDHPRWRRPIAAAGRRGARSLQGHAVHGEKQLRADQLFPGQHRAGPREPLALPRRSALPLCLRRRAGALLLAAARLPGQTAVGIHAWRTSAANTAPPRAARRAARWPASHQVAYMDFWRDPQGLAAAGVADPAAGRLVQIR